MLSKDRLSKVREWENIIFRCFKKNNKECQAKTKDLKKCKITGQVCKTIYCPKIMIHATFENDKNEE